MKKLAVLIALISVAALAAPAFSATNPFMDVPMNHWAYDAIGQLAAHGILSGYPDGLYKGQQQTTRYELASALARSLAVVDMTKASKQDVEMLKRLVVEFKDELEALGVRVDELDERVAVFENRLGGWHIHGSLVLDVKHSSGSNAFSTEAEGSIGFDEARLFIERTFGENDEYFFRVRIRDETISNAYFDRFYVTMPFFFDSRLTVGRFLWDDGAIYRLALPETGSWTGDSVLTDWGWTGFGLEKNFALGTFKAAVAHPNKFISHNYIYINYINPSDPDNGKLKSTTIHENASDINEANWMAYLIGQIQFTEQLGFDIGGQVFVGDNAETDYDYSSWTGSEEDIKKATGNTSFKNLWTVFAGLRFDFNDNIGLKGIFYHQAIDSERVDYEYENNEDGTRSQKDNSFGWHDYGYGLTDKNGKVVDDANHWAVMIDLKQELLKYTSLWLEYGQYDKGFWAPQGMSTIFPSESNVLKSYGGEQVNQDLKYWRIALGQQWNEQWATHIFYYGYIAEDAKTSQYRGEDGLLHDKIDDAKPSEFGVGVQYKLNDYTTMGLNYVHVDSDQEGDDTEDNIIRFRTKVAF